MTWIFLLLIWGLLTKRPPRKKKLLIWTFAVFYFFTNNFIVDEFFRAYEQRDDITLNMDEHFDIAIVLGGYMTYDPHSGLEGFNQSSDRFIHAFKLLNQKKVDRILISGGSGSLLNPGDKESELVRKFLLKLGYDYEHFIFDRESRNTHQNAVESKEHIQKNKPNGKYLLITSGYHMPRAKRCFEKEGIPVTTYSVDHYVGERRWDFAFLFLPSIQALERWNILMHEWVGMFSYWIVGYI